MKKKDKIISFVSNDILLWNIIAYQMVKRCCITSTALISYLNAVKLLTI